MKHLLLLACLWPGLLLAGEDPRQIESRELSLQLQKALGKELKAAMQAGGPPAAIQVCNERAPVIAEQISVAQGAQVGRTSLRVRNPANAPDTEARAVLESFQQSVDDKLTVIPESFTVRTDGSARYMRAIYLQPLCSTCHGQSISPAVESLIHEYYPLDEATGYAVGELRGAFVVDWPSSEEARP